MSNLVVEIGNTALKAAWTEGMTLGKTFRYQGEKFMEFILSLTKKEKPYVMLISSVNPLSAEDIDILKAECSSLLILDENHTEQLKRHGLPPYISYDRAASIIAARHLFNGKGCTIVDFGTTLSVDFTNREGLYEGGNISLGCRTRFKALNRYSRALPLVDTPENPELIGSSRNGSIESGVVSGIVFEIEGYLALKPDNMVVFTGGDANYFAKRVKSSIFVVCNLVLMGLALLSDEYEQRIA
ncbi:MAG: type III pantothenate kinase [Bacteroidales bacterium]|nr:type III pantothenate kinase [Bacteroidales bacterium]MBR6886473.1 type III pantothenate kinase [Bacteroidales bacterium]